MTLDVFLTIVKNAFNRTEKNPLELLSLILGAAAVVVATPLLRFENFTTTEALDVIETPDSENEDPGIVVSTPLPRFEKDTTTEALDVTDNPDPIGEDPGLQDGCTSEGS